MNTVCVIGAGIVGCATAYQLARDGVDVLLVDAAPEPATLTSFANGAQLSYSYVEPFASPATLRALPKMLLAPDSPVRFRPSANPRQWGWGLRFLLACREERARAGTATLIELAGLSRRTLEAWMRDEHWSFLFSTNGKLVLCPDSASLAHQAHQVGIQAALGCHQEVLTPADCRRIEPALAADDASFVGGIWTADECVADPYLLCRELVQSLRALGGRTLFGQRVETLVRAGGRYVAARTAQGDLRADAFVLATGPQSTRLAASIGLSLPIWPIRGYSLTAPFRRAARPRVSVTHLGQKTVFAPLGEHLRVAAFAEIDGGALKIPAERIETMKRNVEALYPGLCDLAAPQTWAGLRPATPDSLPIIRRHRESNLVLNTGHGGLGLTLAAGSARLAADLVQRQLTK